MILHVMYVEEERSRDPSDLSEKMEGREGKGRGPRETDSLFRWRCCERDCDASDVAQKVCLFLFLFFAFIFA